MSRLISFHRTVIDRTELMYMSPGSIGDRLYQSRNSEKERSLRTFEERELEKCTFRPDLVSRRPKSASARTPRGGGGDEGDGGGGGWTNYEEDAAQRHIERVRRASAAKEMQFASEVRLAQS